MNALSDDNLKYIFRFLPAKILLSLELVCQRWRLLAKQNWTYYTVVDSEDSAFLKDKPASQIHYFLNRCGCYILHATFASWSVEVVLECLKSMPNLLHLQFYEVELGTETLAQISQLLPDLKSVYLDLWVDDTDLDPFLTNAQALEYLKIGTLYSALKEDVPIAHTPPNLKYLELSGDQEFYLLDSVGQNCKSLNSLVIYSQVTDQMIGFVGKLTSLNNLEIGLLVDDQGSEDSDNARIFKRLNNLRALTLQEADQWITKAVTENCERVEWINIQDSISCKDALPLAGLPNLSSLEVNGIEGSTDDLDQLITFLSEKGKLEHIWLGNDENEISLETLSHLIQSCKLLKTVHLHVQRRDLAYSKLCKLVDEANNVCRKTLHLSLQRTGKEEKSYKWLIFDEEFRRPSKYNPWKYAGLSAGKPSWA